MATTYTEVLELPKHELTDPFDITLINDMADKVDAGMANAFKGMAAQNLIDNGFFLDVVNQRGESSYVGAKYGIDRWGGVNAASTVKVTAQGVSIQHTGTTGNAGMQQMINPSALASLAPASVTLSVCLGDGTVYTVSGPISTYGLSVNFPGGFLALQAQSPTAVIVGIINNVPGSTITVRWAAMYVGTYTLNTLPAYKPKGYLAELLECKRYFVRVRSGMLGFLTKATGYFIVQTEVPMRIAPTVTVEDMGTIRAGGASITPTAITASSAGFNSVSLNVTYESQTLQNHTGVLLSTLALSADL